MQNQDLNFLLENVVSSKELVEHLKATEADIKELCRKCLLEAKYLNNEWRILRNQELPCLIQFDNLDLIDKNNYNILHGKYDIEYLEELANWPIEATDNYHYFDFQHICIDKGAFRDASGKVYNRYILEIETFLEVASSADSMEKALLEIEDAKISPQKNEFVAVFNNKFEAFTYAYKLYPEFPLEEFIRDSYSEY